MRNHFREMMKSKKKRWRAKREINPLLWKKDGTEMSYGIYLIKDRKANKRLKHEEGL